MKRSRPLQLRSTSGGSIFTPVGSAILLPVLINAFVIYVRSSTALLTSQGTVPPPPFTLASSDCRHLHSLPLSHQPQEKINILEKD